MADSHEVVGSLWSVRRCLEETGFLIPRCIADGSDRNIVRGGIGQDQEEAWLSLGS